MPEIIETTNNWILEIDDDLLPSTKYDYLNKKKKVIRHWGYDTKTGNEYTSHVVYPKKHFTKKYVEEKAAPKFDNCPHCRTSSYSSDDNDDGSEPVIKAPQKSKFALKKRDKIILAGVVASSFAGLIGLLLNIKRKSREEL